jgi:phospholipid transport system transporter-binding protein
MSTAGTSAQLRESAPGKFVASGALTFATARAARELGLAAFGAAAIRQDQGRQDQARDIQVDCSGITASDSAGMTVLLDWLAIAKRTARSMRFDSLPSQVQAIARISDVLEFLEKGV